MFRRQLSQRTGSMKITYQGKEFDLTPPWRKLDMAQAIKDITGVDFAQLNTDEEARKAAIEKGMDRSEVSKMSRGKILAEMFEEFCEDAPGLLDGPCFYNRPSGGDFSSFQERPPGPPCYKALRSVH